MSSAESSEYGRSHCVSKSHSVEPTDSSAKDPFVIRYTPMRAPPAVGRTLSCTGGNSSACGCKVSPDDPPARFISNGLLHPDSPKVNTVGMYVSSFSSIWIQCFCGCAIGIQYEPAGIVSRRGDLPYGR